MVTEQADRQFEAKARELLKGDEAVSDDIAQRLAKARQAAMQEYGRRRIDWRLPAASAAAAAVVAALIWTSNPQPVPVAGEIEDLDLLMAEENLEFFEDLDFYLWVELELSLTSENAS